MGVFGLDSWARQNVRGRLVAFSKEQPQTLVLDLSNFSHQIYAR